MTLSGISPDGRLVEAAEISKNDFFIGVQSVKMRLIYG